MNSGINACVICTAPTQNRIMSDGGFVSICSSACERMFHERATGTPRVPMPSKPELSLFLTIKTALGLLQTTDPRVADPAFDAVYELMRRSGAEDIMREDAPDLSQDAPEGHDGDCITCGLPVLEAQGLLAAKEASLGKAPPHVTVSISEEDITPEDRAIVADFYRDACHAEWCEYDEMMLVYVATRSRLNGKAGA